MRQALLNVAQFCDRILVADHMSTDRTPEILRELAHELDNLELRRVTHAAESHAMIEPFAGTDTWILAVDGDELYDPSRLMGFRRELEKGAFADVFRIRPAGLHCDELEETQARASGYLSPPGRPLLGLLNFAAIDSWRNVRSQRLHGGDVAFRRGFDRDKWRHLGVDFGWEKSPFRDLHACFLSRSSSDDKRLPTQGRPNLSETYRFRHGVLGSLEMSIRRLLGRAGANASSTSGWKAEKYRRGDRVTVDASAFLRAP